MALVCDTGPILAALDRDDRDHKRCSELIANSTEDLVVPTLVLGEVDYWCRKLGIEDAWLAFLEDVDAGAWRVEHPSLEDLRRARALQRQYMDLRLGIVDASLAALVERWGELKVATLDHRHFSVIRLNHVSSLTLEPG